MNLLYETLVEVVYSQPDVAAASENHLIMSVLTFALLAILAFISKLYKTLQVQEYKIQVLQEEIYSSNDNSDNCSLW